MIARLDHRPILMAMALAVVVCVLLLAVTLLFAAPNVPSVDLNTAPSHSDMVRTMML
jgi:uncharacterized integral membrane protein